MLTKRPIQVYLEVRQERALRWLANRKNTTLSDLIRRGVDLVLSQTPETDDPALAIVGLGNSNVSDLGQNHGIYVIEELEKKNDQ